MKIIVVGECGAGKTCMIRRYMHDNFQPTNKATIGVDFALKVLPASNTTLQIWDIAGQERYGQMTRVYFLSAAGAMIVCEINKPESYDAAVKWKQDVDSKVFLPGTQSTPVPCLLVLNKSDLGGSHLNEEQLQQFVTANGFAGYIKCSAKDGSNIEKAFDDLVRYVQEKLDNVPQKGAQNAAQSPSGERADQNQTTVRLGRKPPPKPAEKKQCPC